MDIEKLIVSLRSPSWQDLEDPDATLLDDAAHALSTLQDENMRLKSLLGEGGQDLWSKENQRADRLEAENEKLRAELERMKKIMRDNGILVIQSKYPGGRSEWNIPKPRGPEEG
jgi:hypothetical protein